jgi:hypothetical protein
MWRIRKQIPYNRRARNFLRTFLLLLLLPHPVIRSTPAEIPGPLSSLSVLALPLARALAVFALRIVESGAFTARRDRIEYKSFVSEVSVRRLSFVDFLWYRVRSLNLFHYLSEFRRVLQLLLVCGRTPVCIAVCVFPVLCRNGGISRLCFLLSCSYYYRRCVRSQISWFHGLRGLRAFIADGEGTWC